MTYDLVIRNGAVLDGLGNDPIQADVAVVGGRIVKVGSVVKAGREEIDATGLLVTPGFVDIHTHYDGQVSWTSRIQPSSNHGVTTIVMGNCGVGFAPCRAGDRDHLIRLMEGVEDIPGAALAEGIPWEWETFPEFLDFLASRSYDVDIAAHLPHAPLRVYAMGQRALDREPATTADLARMKALTAEAMAAGAVGVATSRSLGHRSSDHQLLPGVSAAEGELISLGEGIRASGGGVLQCIVDFAQPEIDFAMLRRLVEKTGLPLSFTLVQTPRDPELWRSLLAMTEEANHDGLPIRAQVFPRPQGVILGLRLQWNFFSFSPSYKAIADLAVEERLAAMRDPATRRLILGEFPAPSTAILATALYSLDNIFLMDETPNYEPPKSESISARARRLGLDPVEHAYDLLIGDDGKNVFYIPAVNYVDGNLDVVSQMLKHPHTLVGLGDGGAHVGVICDASAPTYMLQRWAGDGRNGTLTLPQVVKALTSTNANAVNLRDRGVIAPGYRADINVIDRDRLALERPTIVNDLPDRAARLHQKSRGYVATIVAGEITYREGKATGRLPGRLVRGVQPLPTNA